MLHLSEAPGQSRRRFLRRAIGLGGSLILAPALLVPAKADGLVATPSPDEQKKAGDDAAKQVLKQYPEIHDARADHFIRIGQRLVAALPDEDKNWNFRFHVLDSKDVNAFALPGGEMFMFTGLYQKLTTDDALAAVTGHEMTHVRKQHWAKRYAADQSRALGIAAVLSIFHAGRTVQSFAGFADNALSLKYSRGEEDQADQGGLENMVAAGFNPEGMLQLFQTLEQLAGNGGLGGKDWVSDHPLTSDRIQHARDRIAQMHHDQPFPSLTPFSYADLLHPQSAAVVPAQPHMKKWVYKKHGHAAGIISKSVA